MTVAFPSLVMNGWCGVELDQYKLDNAPAAQLAPCYPAYLYLLYSLAFVIRVHLTQQPPLYHGYSETFFASSGMGETLAVDSSRSSTLVAQDDEVLDMTGSSVWFTKSVAQAQGESAPVYLVRCGCLQTLHTVCLIRFHP